MTPRTPSSEMDDFYDTDAREYLESLPLSHFMESVEQSTQRSITVASLALIHVARPEVQCFSELLIQYPEADRRKPGKVVPDNFVVVHEEPIVASGSFVAVKQPARPFLVLEYVSKQNKRKDYEDNFDKYQANLKVPYHLMFYPDNEELSLFNLVDGAYRAVRPNASGRYAIPDLELEVAILGSWVRFWFRGALLPLPGDLLVERDAAREQRDEALAAQQAAEQRAETERRNAGAERQARLAVEAEVAKLREELAKARGEA